MVLELPVAMFLSALPALAALFMLWRQWDGWRRLRAGPTLPSGDRDYLRARVVRRTVLSLLTLLMSGMLAGAYLSGMMDRADALGHRPPDAPPLTNADRAFVNVFTFYWIGFLALLFVVLAVAFADLWATRRYALREMKRLRDDHRTLLERDLAVHRQRRGDRFRRGGRTK